MYTDFLSSVWEVALNLLEDTPRPSITVEAIEGGYSVSGTIGGNYEKYTAQPEIRFSFAYAAAMTIQASAGTWPAPKGATQLATYVYRFDSEIPLAANSEFREKVRKDYLPEIAEFIRNQD